MSSFIRQCVQTYTELAGTRTGSLRKVEAHFLTDDAEIDVGGTEGEPAGQLAPIALRALTKALYAARGPVRHPQSQVCFGKARYQVESRLRQAPSPVNVLY